MSNTILNQILSYKKHWILKQENKFPLNILKSRVQNSTRDFYHTMFYYKNQSIFILEYKKASPSYGIICKNANPIKIANSYKNYASIISVVTDEKYFQGNFDILSEISHTVTQPILCKDFFISEWQIYFARLNNADAILLMLSVLDDNEYLKFTHIAHSLHMGVLTEIINEQELKRAINLNAKIIGINNRNLHDLSINLNRTINLSKNIPNSIITISESGITNYSQIRKLRRYVNGFLIGTVLMSSTDSLNIAINKLLLGENKICGLTQPEDACIAHKLGSVYGGLIFAKHSPRYINILTAQKIISVTPNFYFIGVFYNENINFIINTTKTLNLYAVQLHGFVTQNYINKLKSQLPTTCQIWKSINMNQKPLLIPYNLLYIDRYILDNNRGGSGKTFDWSLLSNITLNKSILAGGLTINNCSQAAQLGCLGLDFNSGIENSPGIKNHQKLIKIFTILRNY